MENIFSFADPHFWVLLATIVFAVIGFAKGKGPLLAMLDSRTARIKNNLEESERLKNEAQEILAEAQRKHRDAIQTSQKIIDAAKQTSDRLAKESVQKLEDSMNRKETQLLERIKRAELSAVEELRHQAADLAARTAEALLQEAMPKRGAKLVDEAIAEIPAKLAS